MNPKTTAKFLACTALVALAGGAQADTALRLAHWLPPSHALQTTGFEPWTQSISEASGGKISFSIFPAQQLGSATDHYDLARDGSFRPARGPEESRRRSLQIFDSFTARRFSAP